MKKLTPNIRRAIAVALLLTFFLECFYQGYLLKEDRLGGASAHDLAEDLAEVWGPEHEEKVIGEVLLPGGLAAVRETMTFTMEPVPARSLPKLWLLASGLLTGAAVFFFPGSAVCWAVSLLCTASGMAATPFLVPLGPNMVRYRCTVRIDRWVEGTDHRASMTAIYWAYENVAPGDTTRAWVDLDSAETVYTPQGAVFNDPSLLVQ